MHEHKVTGIFKILKNILSLESVSNLIQYDLLISHTVKIYASQMTNSGKLKYKHNYMYVRGNVSKSRRQC